MARIETGHAVTRDVKVVQGKRVRFVDDDGRTVFEVGWGTDCRSIEVRGVECTKNGGDELFGPGLDLRLQCSNVVTVMVRPWEE